MYMLDTTQRPNMNNDAFSTNSPFLLLLAQMANAAQCMPFTMVKVSRLVLLIATRHRVTLFLLGTKWLLTGDCNDCDTLRWLYGARYLMSRAAKPAAVRELPTVKRLFSSRVL
jgi:hypothetical protein